MVWGSNPGGGQVFRTRPDRPWDPPTLPYNGYRVPFSWVKRQGRGVNHPAASSAEVKERVELCLRSLSGPSWPVLERTLPFSFSFRLDVMQFNFRCRTRLPVMLTSIHCVVEMRRHATEQNVAELYRYGEVQLVCSYSCLQLSLNFLHVIYKLVVTTSFCCLSECDLS
jgi:hypothetical protein